MQPNKLRARKKLGSSVYLIALIGIMVAIILVGCSNNETAQKPRPLTGQSPSATPSPTPTPEALPPADTIIVIRDGSVHMKVEKAKCQDDDQGDMKGYKCRNVDLKELVSSTGTTKLALDEDSKITIDGGGGPGKDINIKQDGGDVKITFKKDQYKPCQGGNPGEHCADNQVGTIFVKDPDFSQLCDKCVLLITAK